jgi:hypothetical protein
MSYFKEKKRLKGIKMPSSFDYPNVPIQRTFEKEHEKYSKQRKAEPIAVVGALYHGDNIAQVERQLKRIKK